MDEKILNKMLNIAENFFGSENDPEQMPVTKGSFYKLRKLHPKSVIYRVDNGEPISWVVILPTSKELMERFLNKEINERELLEMTKPSELYDALYLCAAFTVPEYRRRGYIMEMLREGIDSIPHTKDTMLFAWPVSEEGKKIIEKVNSMYNLNIKVRE